MYKTLALLYFAWRHATGHQSEFLARPKDLELDRDVIILINELY